MFLCKSRHRCDRWFFAQYWQIFYIIRFDILALGNIIAIVNETRQRTVAMNFDWSLKPVFVLLAVTFGIDLDRSKEKSTILLCLTTFFGVFLLVCINIPLNLYYIVIETKIFTDSTSSNSFVYNSTLTFGWILCAILSISIHILILVSSKGKWKPLWEKFQLLQIYIGDEGGFYRRVWLLRLRLRLHTNNKSVVRLPHRVLNQVKDWLLEHIQLKEYQVKMVWLW